MEDFFLNTDDTDQVDHHRLIRVIRVPHYNKILVEEIFPSIEAIKEKINDDFIFATLNLV